MTPRLDADGLYLGSAASVRTWHETYSGGPGFAVMWEGRQVLGLFGSKEVANGIAATFDALTPEGTAHSEPPIDALLELVGFRQILAEVVSREAKRLQAEELATRVAAQRLRGRAWP